MRALAVLTALAIAACDEAPRTLGDIVRKAGTVETRADLERALGRPHKLTVYGTAETWTYKATDGEISFLVVGNRIQR